MGGGFLAHFCFNTKRSVGLQNPKITKAKALAGVLGCKSPKP